MGSFSQTLFFGGVTQKPEIRLCSQANLRDKRKLITTSTFKRSVYHRIHSFFYKNLFYKNLEAEFCLKFKNILRTLPRLRVG